MRTKLQHVGPLLEGKVDIGSLVFSPIGAGHVTFMRPPFKDGQVGMVTVEIDGAKYLFDPADLWLEWVEEEKKSDH